MGKILRFLRPDRMFVVLVLVLTFGQTMSSLYLPNLMSNIVDTGIVKSNEPYILRIGLWMLAVTLIGGVAAVFASYFGAKATAGFGQRLRTRLFTHVEHFTLKEFDTVSTSSLIVRTTNDVMQVQQLVNMMLRMMVMAPLTAIGGIILAVHVDARLSLMLVVVLPIMGLVIWLLMRRGLRLFRSIQKKLDRLNLVLRENLTGVRVIRSFDRAAYEVDRFDQANVDLTETSVQVFQIMATLMPTVMLVMNLATVAIVWFGAHEVGAGTLEVGNLMAFIQYVMQIMFAVMMVSMMLFMIPRGQASALRIQEVLDMEPEITDPRAPILPQSRAGRVEFDHVTFRYPGGEEPALYDITFTALPGEVTAVIGGTGAGKSTLINLIMRLYDVTQGSVRVDDVDVRDMTQEELRSRLGYVPQKAVLFTGSVLDNLRYGSPDVSRDAAQHVADIAQASEFIGEFPEGLDAWITQGGTNLSGGQKQRLSIARALTRRAEIHLFDDTFSSLDYRTDALVRQALKRELHHVTVIIVAQRVSTVMDADRILVLDEGRLVGQGRHSELMKSCPVYQEIVSSQLTPEEIA